MTRPGVMRIWNFKMSLMSVTFFDHCMQAEFLHGLLGVRRECLALGATGPWNLNSLGIAAECVNPRDPQD
jgi:hypothetical protein